MAATIRDVSKLSGLSTATVSRAYSEPEKLKEETRKKVFEAAKLLDYQPSAIGRAMARQKTETIAFIICKKDATILDEYYASICEGIMDEVNLSDYQLLISTADQWHSAAGKLRSKQVDAFIFGGDVDRAWLEKMKQQKTPFILVNNNIIESDYPCVVADEFGGVKQVMDYFHGKGHKRVGFLMGQFSPYIFEQRYKAFFELKDSYGFEWKDSYYQICDLDLDQAIASAKLMLGQEERPSAIFASNDQLGAGVMKAAKELNIRIPEDLALIAYDDLSFCRYLQPALSSVHVNCYEMGKRAAERLFGILEKRPLLPKETSIPTSLTLRASC